MRLLSQFSLIRQNFLNTLSIFPVDKAHEPLFGGWDLKDVMAHFVGWDVEFINALKSFAQHEKYDYWGKIYVFNERVVNESKEKSWETILSEFKQSGQVFIDVYKEIPEELMEVKIWKDKIYTPKRILEINIHHYEKAQLVQIKKYLVKWGL